MKHPQDNFNLQMREGKGRLLCSSIQNDRLEVVIPFSEGANFHFGEKGGGEFGFLRPCARTR